MDCLEWWDIQIPITQTTSAWFECWLGVIGGGFQWKLWISLFFVVTWTFWYQRNNMIFENNHTDLANISYLVRLRLGFWLKG